MWLQAPVDTKEFAVEISGNITVSTKDNAGSVGAGIFLIRCLGEAESYAPTAA
jgi:hypothetical protein